MIKITTTFLMLLSILIIILCTFIGFAINRWIIKDYDCKKDKIYMFGGLGVGVVISIIIIILLRYNNKFFSRHLMDSLKDVNDKYGINYLDTFIPFIKSSNFNFPNTCARSINFL
jgi:uncharacterized BrkB/YihY/UPF0761 family membrane protein